MVRQDELGLMLEFGAMAVVGAFDVDQDRSVGEGAVAE